MHLPSRCAHARMISVCAGEKATAGWYRVVQGAVGLLRLGDQGNWE